MGLNMKTLHRNKRKMYVCELHEENKNKYYKEPIELYENWQLTNTDGELMNLGLELFNYARIRTSVEHAKYYHVGDRVYLYTTPPTEHDNKCKTADYQVYRDPIVTLNECTVWLQKVSGRNANSIY